MVATGRPAPRRHRGAPAGPAARSSRRPGLAPWPCRSAPRLPPGRRPARSSARRSRSLPRSRSGSSWQRGSRRWECPGRWRPDRPSRHRREPRKRGRSGAFRSDRSSRCLPCRPGPPAMSMTGVSVAGASLYSRLGSAARAAESCAARSALIAVTTASTSDCWITVCGVSTPPVGWVVVHDEPVRIVGIPTQEGPHACIVDRVDRCCRHVAVRAGLDRGDVGVALPRPWVTLVEATALHDDASGRHERRLATDRHMRSGGHLHRHGVPVGEGHRSRGRDLLGPRAGGSAGPLGGQVAGLVPGDGKLDGVRLGSDHLARGGDPKGGAGQQRRGRDQDHDQKGGQPRPPLPHEVPAAQAA